MNKEFDAIVVGGGLAALQVQPICAGMDTAHCSVKNLIRRAVWSIRSVIRVMLLTRVSVLLKTPVFYYPC